MAILGALILGLGFLAIKGSEEVVMSTEIEISAPPEAVWAALQDINTWHQWSPFINKSKGDAALDSVLDITMVGPTPDQDGPQYQPRITQFEEAKVLRWRAHMMAGFLFTNDKVLELSKTATGTKLVHKEVFTGMLAPVFCGPMEKTIPPMLDSMNTALKNLVENKK